MITLEINGQEIQLPTDFKLTRVFEGAYYSGKNIAVPRTYGISFEPTPSNILAMEFANDLRVKERKKHYSSIVKRSGSVIMRGNYVSDTIDDLFSGTIVGTRFLELIEKKNLQDFFFAPELVMGTTSQEVANYALEYHPDANIGFPEVEMEDYYGSGNPDFYGVVNFRVDSESGLVNEMNYVTEDMDNRYSLLPAFNLLWVLKCVITELGYTPKGDFFTKPNLDKLLLFGSKSLDKLGGEGFKCTGSLTGSNTGDTGLIYDNRTGNEWNTNSYPEDRYITPHEGKYRATIQFDGQMGDPLAHTVQFCKVHIHTDSGILTAPFKLNGSTQKFIERTWEFNWDTIGHQIWFSIEWEGETTTGAAAGGFYTNLKVDIKNIQSETLNVYQKSLIYADHMPNMLASNLIKECSHTFNLSVRFKDDKKEVHINLLDEKLRNNEFWDITDKVIAEDERLYKSLTIPEEEGVELKWKSKVNDETFVIGEGEKKVKMNLCPCKLIDIGREIWKDKWKANSELIDSKGNDDILRFAYHSTHDVPMDLSLVPNSNSLLDEHLLETHTRLAKATPVTMNVDFNTNDLEALDVDEKLMVDHNLFLLKKLTVNEDSDGPGISKLELWKF